MMTKFNAYPEKTQFNSVTRLPRTIIRWQISLVFVALFLCNGLAFSSDVLRLGVLKFGTVNWIISVIKQLELDKKYGINIEVVPLAAKNSAHISIQGGASDMIVSDWIWVSRQRANGSDYTFAPYSTATGAVIVRNDSGIDRLQDLQGKRMGVAGGPVDKSWLLLSAFTRKNLGIPIENLIQPSFAAPPLINQLIISGELSAVLNFWHYTARLEATGMKALIRVKDVLPSLGIEKEIPLIGWVFSESWARHNPAVIEGFLAAAKEAQQIMRDDEQIWHKIRPLMQVDDAVAAALITAYREGIIDCFNRQSVTAIQKAFAIIAKVGGAHLTGNNTILNAGTVWSPIIDANCN